MLIRFTALLPIVLMTITSSSAQSLGDRPNILLIIADDVGIEGLGCYGGVSYETPHLDRLADEGLRFTHAYSQPLCTPTRVQIMTGKYNHRNWQAFGILDATATTFGHRMKEAGYATGIFGKWQLYSYDPPDFPNAEERRGTGMHPKDAGFDRYSLYHALHTEDKKSRYANPTMLEGTAGQRGELKTYDGRFGEDIWVEQIADFFGDNRSTPKFVYYPMALPHWPFVATPDSPEWNPKDPPAEDLSFIDDMIEYMDTAVGRLLEKLQQQGSLDNTLVLFYSDNGTHLEVVSELADGRQIQGGKATSQQTGIHVPLIAWSPGRIEPGVSDRLVDASDFLPTLLDLAGVEKAPVETDGISFADLLDPDTNTSSKPRVRQMAFFWYDPRPGWDKEKFNRETFALDHDYKLFSTGELYRLTDRPLEEIRVDHDEMTAEDRKAKERLAKFIAHNLDKAEPPSLVDAFGRPIAR